MGPGPARARLGGGTRGTAAQAFKGRRLDPVNSLGEVPPPRLLSMESRWRQLLGGAEVERRPRRAEA
jgi:hypothetical protein